jgi:anti-anti-sigma regulatory factor
VGQPCKVSFLRADGRSGGTTEFPTRFSSVLTTFLFDDDGRHLATRSRRISVTSETVAVVKLFGAIDIRSIHDSVERIKTVIADTVGLEIDLAAVTEVDLTFLQLMESLRRTAQEAGTTLRFAHPASDALRETLRRAGFLSHPPDKRTRFWLAETGPQT